MAPRKANAANLPDAEVQALADLALKAWENGREETRVDSLGGVWTFLAVRDPQAALTLSRRWHEDAPVACSLGGQELGAHETVRALLASTVLAMAAPA